MVVRTEGRRRVRRTLKHYNLDAVISVGYRVKSPRGTQFRIRATRTMRDHPVRGCTLNERRLAERGLREARETLDLLARTLLARTLLVWTLLVRTLLARTLLARTLLARTLHSRALADDTGRSVNLPAATPLPAVPAE